METDMPDINYLLFLQNMRNATGGAFDEFFNALSKFAVDIMPFLPFVVLWAVDKRWGRRFMATLWIGEFINGLIKLTVCAYRPWIRSDKIEPAGDSKVAATGYSFPSGHSMVATGMYGTTAAWQWKKRRWLSILFIVLIALTCFSRNFLGVHTPQDVVVGFSESLLLIFVVGYVQKRTENSERAANVLSVIGIAAIIVGIIYVKMKPYPMDYVNGALLVDPKVMMNDFIFGCGGLAGFIVGDLIDRKAVHYEIPVGSKNLPILACTGAALAYAWRAYFLGATLIPLFGPHWGRFTGAFLMVMFGMVFWPLCIRKFTKEDASAQQMAR